MEVPEAAEEGRQEEDEDQVEFSLDTVGETPVVPAQPGAPRVMQPTANPHVLQQQILETVS